MLLSVFGQAAATPCAEMSAPAMAAATVMDMSAESDAGPDSMDEAVHHMPVKSPQASNHCGDMPAESVDNNVSHCAQFSSIGLNSPCDASCTCCPSHCATVLPLAEIEATPMPRVVLLVTYRDLASSAEPESLIKPPRSA